MIIIPIPKEIMKSVLPKKRKRHCLPTRTVPHMINMAVKVPKTG